MAFSFIFIEDFHSPSLRVFFIFEGDKDKAETTTPLRRTITHYYRIHHFAKGRKIVMQVLFCGREGQPSHEKLYLIFLRWLVETGSRGDNSVAVGDSWVVHTVHAAHRRKCRKAPKALLQQVLWI